MDRAPRPARRPLLLLALLAAAPVLAAAPWAFAEMADAGGPTISFTATGTVPLACGSHPNLSSLRVRTGTRIVFANVTGTSAALTVGGTKVVDLGPGMGAVVILRLGQHEVRLQPQCVVVTATDAVVVNVLTGAEFSGTEESGPPGGPAAPEQPPVILVQPTGAGDGSVPGGVGAGPGGTPSGPSSGSGPFTSTSRGTPGGAAPTATASANAVANPQPDDSLDPPMESVVIDVKSIPLGDPSDPKGGRLLAVISAICVIGVTAAIIRAIVSQRTSSVLNP